MNVAEEPDQHSADGACPNERWLLASDWRGYGMAGWPSFCWRSEENGMRALAGEPRVDLISRERFRDFILALEWWLPPGGNSGIHYRVDENYSEALQTGPKMQLVDAAAPDAANPSTSCGALYGLLPATRAPAASTSGFRTARLVVNGAHVEHWLDGRMILSYELDGHRIRRRVAKSKFADFPRFGRCENGGIVLQHHGSEARFRNLRVQVL